MITLEQAKSLDYGDVLYHTIHKNADGTPQRWRVSGKPKTWKTRPDEVKVPVKHGLYNNDYITHHDLALVCLSEKDAAETVAMAKSVEFGEYLCTKCNSVVYGGEDRCPVCGVVLEFEDFQY